MEIVTCKISITCVCAIVWIVVWYITVLPNKGHFGVGLFVLCKEVVFFGRLKIMY